MNTIFNTVPKRPLLASGYLVVHPYETVRWSRLESCMLFNLPLKIVGGICLSDRRGTFNTSGVPTVIRLTHCPKWSKKKEANHYHYISVYPRYLVYAAYVHASVIGGLYSIGGGMPSLYLKFRNNCLVTLHCINTVLAYHRSHIEGANPPSPPP